MPGENYQIQKKQIKKKRKMAEKKGIIILVVEHNRAELVLATNALKEHGVNPITATNLKDGKFLLERTHDIISGALTSIHYPKSEHSNDPHYPNGLQFIESCLTKGVHVGVCSNDDQNLEGIIRVLKEKNPHYTAEVNLSHGKKDWRKSVKDLLSQKK